MREKKKKKKERKEKETARKLDCLTRAAMILGLQKDYDEPGLVRLRANTLLGEPRAELRGIIETSIVTRRVIFTFR